MRTSSEPAESFRRGKKPFRAGKRLAAQGAIADQSNVALSRSACSVGICFDPATVSGDSFLRGIVSHVRTHNLGWKFYVGQFGDLSISGHRGRTSLDGAIVGARYPSAIVDYLSKSHIPVVDIEPPDEVEHARPFPSVMPDDEAIGRMVAEHFLSRAFIHLGFAGLPRLLYCNLRLRGFRTAAENAGKSVHAFENPGENWNTMNWPENSARLDAWVASLPKPVAIMATTDFRSRHVMSSCRRLKLRVPEDVVICGVDNHIAICEMSAPALSSVPINTFKAGQTAAALLGGMMRGQAAPAGPIRIPPLPLIVRASSDALAVDEPDVRTAAWFIQKRSSRPLKIEHVVKAVLISRTGLERKFRLCLGRTIQEEIWRVHVERAKRLLTETEDDMRSVARQSGFRSPQRFSIVFRRETGVTPTVFRQRHLR